MQKKIVGRREEVKALQNLLGSLKAEFIAIYGRRRIGKTYLVKNFFSSSSCCFFHATGIQNSPSADQLKEFSHQIGVSFYQGAPIAARTQWRDVFEDLTQAMKRLPKNKKIVLFLDELPWMATPRSKLLDYLGYYWNRYWAFDSRVKLIICGSATSWIIENIINNKGGLHNRVTYTMQLNPFTLSETKELLQFYDISLNHRQILDLYIAVGGVPLYWSYIQKGNSAYQSIDKICFQKNGPLFKEFDRLFASLFENPKPYIDLLRIIAKHRYGIGQAELIVKSKLPVGGNTVRRLKQLEEAGFITSMIPYGHKGRGVYYVVDDEYSLFFLHWIEPNAKTLSKKSQNSGFWLSQTKQSSWKSWAGYAYEAICYKHIDKIRKKLELDPGSIVATWRFAGTAKSEGAQIDLLFDSPDGTITICEIKYACDLFSIDKNCAKSLLKKMEVFRKQSKSKKHFFLSMITTCGLKPTMYSEEIVTNQVVLDDLF